MILMLCVINAGYGGINQLGMSYEVLYIVLGGLYIVAVLLTFAIPNNKEAIDYEEAQQEFSKIEPSIIE